ncbi:hypothetical protein OZX68_00210 [Streptococcaceae bacterium ESL0729]|nr:hypothetical protein OZX68_00210 [Streptococcaceae bacterium ESL0729]
METLRDGLKENRESFDRAKEKRHEETTIDINRKHVAEETARKKEKHEEREVVRRAKEEEKD